ncbi:uncharacterized protein T551_02505 [Pneumocystis jirovecii RU7]|uniref:Uncharacterized protein n=1 Tax=Pneumocystis jirovecii (strain RU7) TaxID=1408657 RepID=A0A0W4ZJW6_PNEJ7|nr:uncharacterized protein T551_02505 [Pneumocystis jirovecii RU7]KTW28655.1 hypothetical protein T551_02505 [Pneumocystis jirovecii RU7]
MYAVRSVGWQCIQQRGENAAETGSCCGGAWCWGDCCHGNEHWVARVPRFVVMATVAGLRALVVARVFVDSCIIMYSLCESCFVKDLASMKNPVSAIKQSVFADVLRVKRWFPIYIVHYMVTMKNFMIFSMS